MSYSIGYGFQPQEHVQKNNKSHLGILTFVFFVTFLLGIHLFWPEGTQALRHLLLPVSDQTVSAFHTMVNQVSEGITVSEAVTAFCREVIENAQIP